MVDAKSKTFFLTKSFTLGWGLFCLDVKNKLNHIQQQGQIKKWENDSKWKIFEI